MRNAIRDASQLERILDYSIEQVGHMLSAKRVSDYLKSERRSVSVDTVHGYLKAANAAAIDQVLEDIVCIELLRRGYRVTVGRLGDREIDFIAEKDGDREYYQVAYLLESEATIEWEFSVLEAIGDSYPKTVLSLDEFQRGRSGIRNVNVIDWLLEGAR